MANSEKKRYFAPRSTRALSSLFVIAELLIPYPGVNPTGQTCVDLIFSVKATNQHWYCAHL
jgi:hypothetical protein